MDQSCHSVTGRQRLYYTSDQSQRPGRNSNEMDHQAAVVRYFQDQAGSGIGNYYRGASFQRGHGLGSFLGGLFRAALPLFRSGAAAVGREAARAGAGLLTDVASGSGNFRDSLKRHAEEAGTNLTSKLQEKVRRMTGGGAHKRGRVTARSQSSGGSQRKRTSQKGGKKTKTRKVAKKKKTSKRKPAKKKPTKKKPSKKRARKPSSSSSIPGDIFC